MKPNKNTELLHREKLQNTPFEIIGNEENGYFIAMGKYRLTEPQPTIPLAIQLLEERRWEIIGAMITTTIVLMDNVNSKLKEEIQKSINNSYDEKITDPESLENTVLNLEQIQVQREVEGYMKSFAEIPEELELKYEKLFGRKP